MRIIAGTYEGFCYGWESVDDLRGSNSPRRADETGAQNPDSGEGQPSALAAQAAAPKPLSLVFGYSVHVGCTRSVAMTTSGTRAGQLLVTGGVDERIRIYDLRDRTELGELQQHNGTVTCMEFYKSSHLLTGSEDHTVCIWRVHDWALLHVLGGHKAAVTSLSIHPSGRMALSVSRDRTLRLWNLLEGRCAYIKRLQGEGELVRWSASGERYMTVVGSTVIIYDAATSEALGECKHVSRINSACFVGGRGGAFLATCSDDKNIRFLKAEGASLLRQLDVSHLCPTGRVRDMCHVPPPEGGPECTSSGGTLVAVTSSGGVNVWGIPDLEGVMEAEEGAGAELLEVPLLAAVSVKGEPRFTCIAASLSEVGQPGDNGSGDRPIGVKKAKKRKQGLREKAEDGVVSNSQEAKMIKPPTNRDNKNVSFSRGATSEAGAGEGKLKPSVTAKGTGMGGTESGGGKVKGVKKKKKRRKGGVN